MLVCSLQPLGGGRSDREGPSTQTEKQRAHTVEAGGDRGDGAAAIRVGDPGVGVGGEGLHSIRMCKDEGPSSGFLVVVHARR